MTEEQQKMIKELDDIEEYLLIEISDVPEELRERIAKLHVYLARVNRIWADAKYLLDKKRQSLTEEAKEYGLFTEYKPSIIKDVINAKMADDEYVRMLAERVSRTIVHQCDGLRSLLSWNKEDMKLTRTGY